jgi:cytochrome c
MLSAFRWLFSCALFLQVCNADAANKQSASKGDPSSGEQVYARCMACHALTENRIGPKHCGVFGRRAGTVAGFDYSPALRRSKIVWNEKSLDAFLINPMKYVPGTAMAYAGVPDAKERADVIAWLKQAGARSGVCAPNAK